MSASLDLWLEYGQDLLLTPAGSLQMATGWDQARQRIVRRIATNPAQRLADGHSTQADYIWAPAYGLGLGAKVDASFSSDSLAAIERLIAQGILEDAAVSSSSPPAVQFVRPRADTLWALASVTLLSGQQGTIQMKVS
jgi:hypothetical protein